MPKKIVFFGECMFELAPVEGGLLKPGFAGDVFNSAVYLKRTQAAAEANFFSAVGTDDLSEGLIKRIHEENVNTDFVFRKEDRIVGAYYVQLDDEGERSFTYWRNQSAAKRALDFVNDDVIERLAQNDYFFYSGISLAVIEDDLQDAFWSLLKALREKGVKVIFDPNFRPKLWENRPEMLGLYEQAFSSCDLLLPGIEDFTFLCGLTTVEQVVDYLKAFEIPEIIIKNGPHTVTVVEAERGLFEIPIEAAKTVVDTNSAGDSFNGSYIGARMAGGTIEEAVARAATVAKEVIQHRGAIVPVEAFTQFINELDGVEA